MIRHRRSLNVNRTLRIAAIAAVAGGSLATAGTAVAQNATGAGASFPSKAYQYWCATYGGCSYNSVGSTAGIRSWIGKTVDFSGTDAVVTPEQLAQGGGQITYIPTLLGAITVPINVAGVTGSRVNLTGDVVGQIFAGDIKDWSDPKLKANNKGIKWPAAPITVCVRSDGSGTSFAFSRYLTKVSRSFQQKVNFSQSPPWAPGGTVVKQPQNVGVANCVNSNQNSIGYVDLGDAINAGQQGKIVAIGRPKGGPFVKPSPKSTTAAGLVQRAIKPDLTVDFSAGPLPTAAQKKQRIGNPYPIVSTTWLIFRPDGKNNALGKQVAKNFLSARYQKDLARLGFAPLPRNLQAAAVKRLATVPG
jgi:phosphate transport system substrate-binding protein